MEPPKYSSESLLKRESVGNNHCSPGLIHLNSASVIISFLLCIAIILGCWWAILRLYGMKLWPYLTGLTGLIVLTAFIYVYFKRRATKILLIKVSDIFNEFTKHHSLKLEKSKAGNFFILFFKHSLGGYCSIGLIIPRIGSSILSGEWIFFDFEKKLICNKWCRKELKALEQHTLENALEEILRLILIWGKSDWQYKRGMSEEYLAGKEKIEAEWQNYPVPILS